MLIELTDDLWIESSHVVAVRKVSKNRTNVWCTGQSAVDGAFLIDLPVDEIIERLNAIQAQAFAAELIEDMEAGRELTDIG